jgi:hypothetical protein
MERQLHERLYKATAATERPADVRQALDDFLPNASITVSDRVETARILRRGDQYRIEFGARFLAQELGDDRDLLFVLLHEAYHHVLGHLANVPRDRRGPRAQMITNVAADIMVNRLVCERFFPGGVPLLGRLYNRSSLPECLLIPSGVAKAEDDGTRPSTRRSPPGDRVLSRIRRAFLDALAAGRECPSAFRPMTWQVYRAGWFEETPFEALRRMVSRLLFHVFQDRGKDPSVFRRVLVIGDHDPDVERVEGLPWGMGPRIDEDAIDPFGAGPGGEMEEEELEEPVEPKLSPPLVQAVRLGLDADPNHPRKVFGYASMSSVLYSPGRADYLAMAAGMWPSLFHGARYLQTVDDLRAHVYIDVSGSLDRWAARVYGLVVALSDEIGSPVHLFSTVVVDATLAEIARGLRWTTFGTDFNCVMQHALDHRYRRLVMITDGIGDLDEGLAKGFRTSGGSLFLVLTHGNAQHSPLTAIARRMWELIS